MKRNRKSPGEISFRLLAEGYCKSLENARRLIDDGIILLANERYLGAINSFRLAMEEISKAHLLNQPVDYAKDDQKKWDWLWRAFHNHPDKIRILWWEFGRKAFRNSQEFEDAIKLMISTREDSVYVKYDHKQSKFSSPEESMKARGDLRGFAGNELRLVDALFGIKTIMGMPTVDLIERVFLMQYEDSIRERARSNE